jgi:hypothetical protein
MTSFKQHSLFPDESADDRAGLQDDFQPEWPFDAPAGQPQETDAELGESSYADDDTVLEEEAAPESDPAADDIWDEETEEVAPELSPGQIGFHEQATQPFDPVAETDVISSATTVIPDASESDFFADAEPSVTAPAAVSETHDAEVYGEMRDPGQAAVNAFFGPSRLERPRPERPPLIPKWVWIAIASAVCFVLLVTVGVAVFSHAGESIAVPPLAGMDVGAAKTRLAGSGLTISVSEHRFSTKTKDMILEQTPPAGTKVKRGETIVVVVSAGTETFPMPNVVGKGLLLAKGQLDGKGLDIRIEEQPSQQPSDTVLASNPPAGQLMHTGDIVRLTVAAPQTGQSILLPYDMTGVTVVIDPAPVNDAMTDIPLDVARRLRSLIEASKGKVVATRALAESSTLDPVEVRAKRAADSTSTVAIGFSALTQGPGGIMVYTPSPVLANASRSAKLASKITSDLATEQNGTVHSATSTTDTVLSAANVPWVRVQLGSFASREDVAKFSDSAWEDAVARALYRAIAGMYGRKQNP